MRAVVSVEPLVAVAIGVLIAIGIVVAVTIPVFRNPIALFRALAKRHPGVPVYLVGRTPPFRREFGYLTGQRLSGPLLRYYLGAMITPHGIELWELRAGILSMSARFARIEPDVRRIQSAKGGRRYDVARVHVSNDGKDAWLSLLLAQAEDRPWIRMVQGTRLERFDREWADASSKVTEEPESPPTS